MLKQGILPENMDRTDQNKACLCFFAYPACTKSLPHPDTALNTGSVMKVRTSHSKMNSHFRATEQK